MPNCVRGSYDVLTASGLLYYTRGSYEVLTASGVLYYTRGLYEVLTASGLLYYTRGSAESPTAFLDWCDTVKLTGCLLVAVGGFI